MKDPLRPQASLSYSAQRSTERRRTPSIQASKGKWSQGAVLGSLGCVLCGVCVSLVRRTSPLTCRLLTLVGLGVSLGGFCAKSRTVLGHQALRVETSQGFYYSGFIQPNKQTSGGNIPGVLLFGLYSTKQKNRQASNKHTIWVLFN